MIMGRKRGSRGRGNTYVQVVLGRDTIRLHADIEANWLARQVKVMSTLPLKAVSRVWGRFNELEIPYYLRVPGFKLYSWIFGVK